MKKILLIVLAISGALVAEAQTRVVVRRAPARAVVVTRRPVVVVAPAARVVVRPNVTVVRPVRRARVVVVRH